MQNIPILTIDGPSGVGKGSVALIIARKTGWNLLDSGAIYRSFALFAKQKQINFLDKKSLVSLVDDFDLNFKFSETDELLQVYLNGVNVSKQIRTEQTATMASQIAVIKNLRQALLLKQREFEKPPGLIADGRDMGSIVFPYAKYKFYLTASAKERANRRVKQLQNSNISSKISQVLDKVNKRDKRDIERKNSPLIAAKDAKIIDTTSLVIDEVVTKVMDVIGEKFLR